LFFVSANTFSDPFFHPSVDATLHLTQFRVAKQIYRQSTFRKIVELISPSDSKFFFSPSDSKNSEGDDRNFPRAAMFFRVEKNSENTMVKGSLTSGALQPIPLRKTN
jgi:hypothetical protein